MLFSRTEAFRIKHEDALAPKLNVSSDLETKTLVIKIYAAHTVFLLTSKALKFYSSRPVSIARRFSHCISMFQLSTSFMRKGFNWIKHANQNLFILRSLNRAYLDNKALKISDKM